MTNIKVTNITTEDILASAENDLTQAVYDYMKQPGTRKELRPVLQEMASKEEALEVIQAYVTNTLPFSKQITLLNDVLTAVLRWVQWEALLYNLVELYEIKELWAVAMLV